MMLKISPEFTISTNAILKANKLVHDEMNGLRKDYFPNLSQKEFLKQYIYTDSRFLFLLQFRCLFNGLVDIIFERKLFDFVRLFHPNIELFDLSYLRFHHINQKSYKNKRLDNFLAGPLHYDNYDEDTLTTWIPFQNINSETGSLVTTDNEYLIKNTGLGNNLEGITPKVFHSKSFVKRNKKYIKFLKSKCKTYELKLGQCIIFDKSVLHGSTYAFKKDRISFDLRWKKVENNNNYKDLKIQLKQFRSDALENLYRNNDDLFIKKNKTIIVKDYFFKFIFFEFIRKYLLPLKFFVKKCFSNLKI